jgi:hypothetical protein
VEGLVTKWEYCRIIWIVRQITPEEATRLRSSSFAGSVVTGEVTGMTMSCIGYLQTLTASGGKELVISDLAPTMAQLGLEGWELVSHGTVSVPIPADIFYFKREIAAQP